MSAKYTEGELVCISAMIFANATWRGSHRKEADTLHRILKLMYSFLQLQKLFSNKKGPQQLALLLHSICRLPDKLQSLAYQLQAHFMPHHATQHSKQPRVFQSSKNLKNTSKNKEGEAQLHDATRKAMLHLLRCLAFCCWFAQTMCCIHTESSHVLDATETDLR